jgi:hypothetical protein
MKYTGRENPLRARMADEMWLRLAFAPQANRGQIDPVVDVWHSVGPRNGIPHSGDPDVEQMPRTEIVDVAIALENGGQIVRLHNRTAAE